MTILKGNSDQTDRSTWHFPQAPNPFITLDLQPFTLAEVVCKEIDPHRRWLGPSPVMIMEAGW